MRNFEDWLKTFRASINGYDYYADFEKIIQNSSHFELEINILNALIGAKNIEAKFQQIINKYPECLKAVPILIAVREHEIFCQDQNGAFTYDFDNLNQTPEQYAYFMRETGLFNLLQNHIISNLYDYVTGVEAGLDSNTRKNRGGRQMEILVESYLKKAGITYSKEITTQEINNNWGINLTFAENKRWDFAIKTSSNLYVIETNFYTSGGSKLNETARSYKLIAEEAAKIKGFVFIWITDGFGWKSAKNNLEEIFNVLETLYNIADIEAGILKSMLR